jgi:hypothetical protein
VGLFFFAKNTREGIVVPKLLFIFATLNPDYSVIDLMIGKTN